MGLVSQMLPALFLIIVQVYCTQGSNTTVSAASSSLYTNEATVLSTISTGAHSSSSVSSASSNAPSSSTMTDALSPSSMAQNSITSLASTSSVAMDTTGVAHVSTLMQTTNPMTTYAGSAQPSMSATTSNPMATSSLAVMKSATGYVQPSTSTQTSNSMPTDTSSAAQHSTRLTYSPSSTQTSNPSSASTSSIQPSSSGSSQPSSSLYPTAGVPTTPIGSKKFVFSFKITNEVCSVDIRENSAKSSHYTRLVNTVVAAVNAAFKNDPYYIGSRVYHFDCGSVIPFVEVSKNGSASNNIANELKAAGDMVKSGGALGLVIDTSSFSSSPTASVPNLYIKLDTELSNTQFCLHKSNFKDRFAAILVSTDGQSFVNPGQIVVFGSNCNDQSVSHNAAKISFYVTGSTTQVLHPDLELTNRAYKLIKQFVEDGTTWRLSASFDDKVKSVELAGKDKVEDTAYSELTIVLIGMGATFGLLLVIILIILALIHLRRSKNQESTPLTIRNQSRGLDNARFDSQDEVQSRTAINIEGHDYEYPEAAPREEKKVQPAQVTYQELKPAAKEGPKTTVSLYQPLSADEEQKTSVIVEPEESAGYTVSVLSTKPEAKDLTADELARRKDLENQLKLEFESLEYDMPSSNIYASSLMAKNRLSTVIPKPETRVLLNAEYDNPDSDYINASYVMDFHHNKKYIITQGPLQKTTDDFWRMIDEQNIHVIVMLTPLVQEGMEKCYQYWPPDSVPREYGDIKVHLSKKELKPDFTVTTMEINKNDHQREVVLFRYMSWPENDVPENPKSFVNFLMEAKKANQERGDSIYVVLCSNGVGMSAVFSAVANGIESFDTKKAADIYSIVKGLRRDRAGAIQHFDQYKFVYQALYEYSLMYQDNNDPFANKSNITSTF